MTVHAAGIAGPWAFGLGPGALGTYETLSVFRRLSARCIRRLSCSATPQSPARATRARITARDAGATAEASRTAGDDPTRARSARFSRHLPENSAARSAA